MRITIKICGITRTEDASSAIAAGADALGFNFYSGSPRCTDVELVRSIETAGVLRVGVFVNASPQEVGEIVRRARLDVVQLHGDENPEDYAPLRVWKAYRVTTGWTVPLKSSAEAILLDGPAPGAGVSFDWSLTSQVSAPFVLAGGLDAGNVAEAIRVTRPWGVDACSRLESAPGIKDPEKVARFIQAARTATL
jgi:phosphoribosylanthranilate isomerase